MSRLLGACSISSIERISVHINKGKKWSVNEEYVIIGGCLSM